MIRVLTILLAGTLSVAVQAESPINDGFSSIVQIKEGRFQLGRVMLNEADATESSTDNDTFALGNCSGTNPRIKRVVLKAKPFKYNGAFNLDSLIRSVTFVFGNGRTQVVNYNDEPGGGRRLRVSEEMGDSFAIDLLGERRCVRSVTVRGEQYERGHNHSNSQVDVIGVIGLGGVR